MAQADHGFEFSSKALPSDIAASQTMLGYGAVAERVLELVHPDRLTVALAWKSAIRLRNNAMNIDLISDISWNMLLHIYIENQCGRHVPVTAACFSSGGAETTALRYLRILEKSLIVNRSADPTDKRRMFVALTKEGLKRMEEALDASAESDRRHGLGRLRSVAGASDRPGMSI